MIDPGNYRIGENMSNKSIKAIEKFVNENIAALLLSLESVFGVFFSILFGQEIMTLQIGLGFVIIFISVLISETKLSFLHRGGKQ